MKPMPEALKTIIRDSGINPEGVVEATVRWDIDDLLEVEVKSIGHDVTHVTAYQEGKINDKFGSPGGLEEDGMAVG